MTVRNGKAPPYHHGDLRNALVEAAVVLARQGGPSAIVLREAARQVGVSPNAAYRHFDALPELVGAVAVRAHSELARSMETELGRLSPTEDAQHDARERMLAVGRGYVQFALTEPGLFATAFRNPKDMPETARPQGASGLSPREFLEEALDRLLAVGVLAAEDRAAAATAAWAAVHGLSFLLLGPMADVPVSERAALIDASLDLTIRGIAVRD